MNPTRRHLSASADKPLGDLVEGIETSKSPAEVWEQDTAKRALDELFNLTHRYRDSQAFFDVMKFVTRFRFYSPYSAMLIHVQMPGATYVAPPGRWLHRYRRRISPGARPIVILQPMGPVMFVFDVSDTEPMEDAPPLPPEVENPFDAAGAKIGDGLCSLIDNAKRDGVRVTRSRQGSQSAGSIAIQRVGDDVINSQPALSGFDSRRMPIMVQIPVRYDLVVNSLLSREGQYATIVHELAHLYCGHLGSPNTKWWPNRRGLDTVSAEFEAESVAYLVCRRSRIDTRSERYLANYVCRHDQVPQISLELLMTSARLIENMTRDRLKTRN